MDLDETVDETQDERPLRGFRRRWTSDVAALDEPSPGHISEGVGEDLNLESQPHLFSGSNVDSMEFDQHALDWDFIGHTCDSEEAGPDETLKRALEIDEDLTEPSTCPQVLDPLGTEPSWKAAALTAEVKRARSDFVKLPWEMEGSVFKSRDLWQGTIVSSLDKMFTPSAIGAVDVLGSQVVHERPDKARPSAEVPVLPIQLKRARREPLEEDIRRKALSKFRGIILQDPLATQLGTSLHSNFISGFGHDGIEQSFRY